MADVCGHCQHPFDPHLLVTTGATPMDGGIMICQVVGCACLSTWAAGDRPPRATAVEQLRELDGNADGELDTTAAIERLRKSMTSGSSDV